MRARERFVCKYTAKWERAADAAEILIRCAMGAGLYERGSLICRREILLSGCVYMRLFDDNALPCLRLNAKIVRVLYGAQILY